MPNTEALLQEIEAAFPPSEKPEGSALSFHQSGCSECEYLRQDLEQYSALTLPDEAIRYLHNDLSCLSAQGLRWVLPSYLRRCVTQDAEYDAIETEFLIYNLAPEENFEDGTRSRFSWLSREQIKCIFHFLEWCRDHPYWSKYCAKDIARALTFVCSLTTNGT